MQGGGPGPEAWDDLDALLRDAFALGQNFGWFDKRLCLLVESHGWDGWISPTDKKGFRQRAQFVYRVDATIRYHAFRWEQLRKSQHGLWVYHLGNNLPVCPAEHRAFDGIALPPEHAFWSVWYPPNTYNCGCYVSGAGNPRSARRLGGDPDKPLPGWWDDPALGPDPAFVGLRRPDHREILAAALRNEAG